MGCTAFQGLVSTKRINAYLSMEELKEDYVEKKSFSMKGTFIILQKLRWV